MFRLLGLTALLAATATALSCSPGDVLEYVVTNTATHEGPSAPLVSATHCVTLTCVLRREQWHDVDVQVSAHASPHGFAKGRHHKRLSVGAVVSADRPPGTHTRSEAWSTNVKTSTATFHAGIAFNGSVVYVEGREAGTGAADPSQPTTTKRDFVLTLLQLLQPDDDSRTAALPSNDATADADTAHKFFSPDSVGTPMAHTEVSSPAISSGASADATARSPVLVLHRFASHRPSSTGKQPSTMGSTHSHAVRRDATVARVHKAARLLPDDGTAADKSSSSGATPHLRQEADAVLVRHVRALPPMTVTAETSVGALHVTHPRTVVLHGGASFGVLLDDVVVSVAPASVATAVVEVRGTVSCGAFSASSTAPLSKWQSAFTATLFRGDDRATVPSVCASISMTFTAGDSAAAVATIAVAEAPGGDDHRHVPVASTEESHAARKVWAASYKPSFQCVSETGHGFPDGASPPQAFALLAAELRGAPSLTADSAFAAPHGSATPIGLRMASFLDCFPARTADFSAQFLLVPPAASADERSAEMCDWAASVLAAMRHPTAAQEAMSQCLAGPCCLPPGDAIAAVARLRTITSATLVDRAATVARRDDVGLGAVAVVLRRWKADRWTKAARYGRIFPHLFTADDDLSAHRGAAATHRRMQAEAAAEEGPVRSAPYSQFRHSELMNKVHVSIIEGRDRHAETLGTSSYGVGAVVQNRARLTAYFGSAGSYEHDLDIEASAAVIRLYMLGESCDLAGGSARYRWHQLRDVSPGQPVGGGPYCPSTIYAPNVTAPLAEGPNQNYDMAAEWGLLKPWLLATRGPDAVSPITAADGDIEERQDTSCAAAFDLDVARAQHPETFSHSTFDGLPNGALPPAVLECLGRSRQFYGKCDGDRGQYVLQMTSCLEQAMTDLAAPVLQLDRGQALLDSLAGFFGTTLRWRIASGRRSTPACREYVDCLVGGSLCANLGEECFWSHVRIKRGNYYNDDVARQIMRHRGSFACPPDSAHCRAAGLCRNTARNCIQQLWDSMVKPFQPAVDGRACAGLTAQKLLAVGAAHFVMKHIRELGFLMTYEFDLVAKERCHCVKRSLSTYIAHDDGYTSHYSAKTPLRTHSIRGGARPRDVKPVYGETCNGYATDHDYEVPLPKIPIGFKVSIERSLTIRVAKSSATAARVPGDAPEVTTSVSARFDAAGKWETSVGIAAEIKKVPVEVYVTIHTDAKPIRGTAAVGTRIAIDGHQRVSGSSSFHPTARISGYHKYLTITGCVLFVCLRAGKFTLAASGPRTGFPIIMWRDKADRPGLQLKGYGYMTIPRFSRPRGPSPDYAGGQPFVLCYAKRRSGCPSSFSHVDFHRGDRIVRSTARAASQDIGWLSPTVAPGAAIMCDHTVRSCESLQGRRYQTSAIYDPQPPVIAIARGRTPGIDDPNVTTPAQRCFSVTVTAQGPAPVTDVWLYARVPGVARHVSDRVRLDPAATVNGTHHCFYASYPVMYAYVVASSAAGALSRAASKSIVVDTTPLALKQYTVGCGNAAVTLPAGGQSGDVWVASGAVCVSFDVSVPESGVASSVVFLEDAAGKRLSSNPIPITTAGTATGAVDVTEDGRYRFVLVVTKPDGTTVDLSTALLGLDSNGPTATNVWFVNKTTGGRTHVVGPDDDVCIAWPRGGFYDVSNVTSISATVACVSGETASASVPAADIGNVTELCFGRLSAVVRGERCTGNVTAVDTPGYATSSTVVAVSDATPPVVEAFLVNCGPRAKPWNGTTNDPAVQIEATRRVCFTITAADPEAPPDTYVVRISRPRDGALLTSVVGSFGGANSTNATVFYAFPRGDNFTASLTVVNAVQQRSAPATVLFTANPTWPVIPDNELPRVRHIAHSDWHVVRWPRLSGCNPCPTSPRLECQEFHADLRSTLVREVTSPADRISSSYVTNGSCIFTRIEPSGEPAWRAIPAFRSRTTIGGPAYSGMFSGNTIMTYLTGDLALDPPRQETIRCWQGQENTTDYGRNVTVSNDLAFRMYGRWFYSDRVPGTTSVERYRYSSSLRCENNVTGDVFSVGGFHQKDTDPGWSFDESNRVSEFVVNGGHTMSYHTVNLTWTANATALADDMITNADVQLQHYSHVDVTTRFTFTLTPAQLRSGAATLHIPGGSSAYYGISNRYRVRMNFTTKAADPTGGGKLRVYSTQAFHFLHETWDAWTGVTIKACDTVMPWDSLPPRETIRVRIDHGGGIAQFTDVVEGRNVTEQIEDRGGSPDVMDLPMTGWGRWTYTVWRPSVDPDAFLTDTSPLLSMPRGRLEMSFHMFMLAFEGTRELVLTAPPYLKGSEPAVVSLNAPRTLARAQNCHVALRFVCDGESVEHSVRCADADVNASHTSWRVDFLAAAPELRWIAGNASSGLASCTVVARVRSETDATPGFCSGVSTIDSAPAAVRVIDASTVQQNSRIACGSALVTESEACMTVDVTTPLSDALVAVKFGSASKTVDLAFIATVGGRVCLNVTGQDTAQYAFSATMTSTAVERRWSCAAVKIATIDTSAFVAPFGGSPTNPALPTAADEVTAAAATAVAGSESNVWSGTAEVCLALPKGMLMQPLEVELLVTAQAHVRAEGDATAVPTTPTDASSMPLVASLTGGGLTGSPPRLPYRSPVAQHFCVPLGDALPALKNGSAIYVDYGLHFPATRMKAVARVRATFVPPSGEVGPNPAAIGAATVGGVVGPGPTELSSVAANVDAADGQAATVCFAHRFPQRHGLSVQVRMTNTSSWMAIPQVAAVSEGADPDAALGAAPWVRYKVPQRSASDAGCTIIHLPAAGRSPSTPPMEHRTVENGAVSPPIPMTFFADNSQAFTTAVTTRAAYFFTPSAGAEIKCDTLFALKYAELNRAHNAPLHSAAGIMRLATRDQRTVPLQRVSAPFADVSVVGGNWRGSAELCFNLTMAQESLRQNATLLGEAAAVILDFVALGASGRRAAVVRRMVYALRDLSWTRAVVPAVAKTNFSAAIAGIDDATTLEPDGGLSPSPLSQATAPLREEVTPEHRVMASVALHGPARSPHPTSASATAPEHRSMSAQGLRPADADSGRKAVHYVKRASSLSPSVTLDWRFDITNFTYCVASVGNAGTSECDVSPFVYLPVRGGAESLTLPLSTLSRRARIPANTRLVLQYGYNIEGGYRVVVNSLLFEISSAAPPAPIADTISAAPRDRSDAEVCPALAPAAGVVAAVLPTTRYIDVCFEEASPAAFGAPIELYIVRLKSPGRSDNIGSFAAEPSGADEPRRLVGRMSLSSAHLALLSHGTAVQLCVQARSYALVWSLEVCRTVSFVSALPPAPSPLDGLDICTDRNLTAQRALVGVNWCGDDVSRDWAAIGVTAFNAQCSISLAAGGTRKTSNQTLDVALQSAAWPASLSNGDVVTCSVCAVSPLGLVCGTTNGTAVAAVGDAGEVLYVSYDAPAPPASVAICADASSGPESCRRHVARTAASVDVAWTACAPPANMSIRDYRVCLSGGVGGSSVHPAPPAWCGTFPNTTLSVSVSDAAALSVLTDATHTQSTLFGSVVCHALSGAAAEAATQASIITYPPSPPTIPTATVAASSGSTCVALGVGAAAVVDGGQCHMCGAVSSVQVATHLRFQTVPDSIAALVEGRTGGAASADVLKAAFLQLQNHTAVVALDAWLEGPPVLNVFVPRGSSIGYKGGIVSPFVVRDDAPLCCGDAAAAPCSVAPRGSDVSALISAHVSTAGLASRNTSRSTRIAPADAVGPTLDDSVASEVGVHGLEVTDTALTVCAPPHSPRAVAGDADDGVVYHMWARGEGDDAFAVSLALPPTSKTVRTADARTATSGCVSWAVDTPTRALLGLANVTFHARVVDFATGGRLESAVGVAPLRTLVSAAPPRAGAVTAAVASADVRCRASIIAATSPHRVAFTAGAVNTSVVGPALTVAVGDGFYRYEYSAVVPAADLVAMIMRTGAISSDIDCTVRIQHSATSDVVTRTSEPTAWSVPLSAVAFSLRPSSNVTTALPLWMWAGTTFSGAVTAHVGSAVTAVEASTVAFSVSTTDAAVSLQSTKCDHASLADAAPWFGQVNVPNATPGRCAVTVTPAIASSVTADSRALHFTVRWKVARADTNVTFPGASQSHTIAVWDISTVTLSLQSPATTLGGTATVVAVLRSSTGAAVSVDNSTDMNLTCTAGCTVLGASSKVSAMGRAPFRLTMTNSTAAFTVTAVRVGSPMEPAVNVTGTGTCSIDAAAGSALDSSASSASPSSGTTSSGATSPSGLSSTAGPSSSTSGTSPQTPAPGTSGTPGPALSSDATPTPDTPSPLVTAAPATSSASASTPAPSSTNTDSPQLVISRRSAVAGIAAVVGRAHHLPVRVEYSNGTAVTVPSVAALALVETASGQTKDTCVNATLVRYAPQDPTVSATAHDGAAMNTTDASLLSIRFTAGATTGECGFRLSGPIPGNATWQGAVAVRVSPRVVTCAFTHKVHIPGQPAAVRCLEGPTSAVSASSDSHRVMAVTAADSATLRGAHCPIIGRCSGAACGAPTTASTTTGTVCDLHHIAEVGTDAGAAASTGEVRVYSAHLPGLRLDGGSGASAPLRLAVNTTIATNSTTVAVTTTGVFDRYAFIAATAQILGVPPAQVVIASAPGSGPGPHTVRVVLLRPDARTPVPATEASASLASGCVQVSGGALPSHCAERESGSTPSKVGLAVGLGLGIPLAVLAAVALAAGTVWWFALRHRGDAPEDADTADPPGKAPRNEPFP